MSSSKIDKIKVDALIHSLGLKYNLRDEDMKQLVNSPFLFTYEKLKELDISEVKTEEDLAKLKTSFLYKSFGKIFASYPLINRRNKQSENMINLNKRKWENKK